MTATADVTVVPPRGPGNADDAVYNLLLDGMREVKEQVVRLETHISSRLDSLDQRYIPRSEYEARHSDLRNIATKTEAHVEAEAAKASARIDALEDKLMVARRFAVTTSITALIAGIGLLALILSHLH